MHNTEEQLLHHVLVVEDDVELIDEYQRYFAQFSGMHIYIVQSVIDANQFLKTFQGCLDAAILEDLLNDGVGLSLLVKIKQRFPKAAVVVASGNNTYEYFVKAFTEGIDDYIQKPINMDLLWLKLNKALRLLQLQAKNTEQARVLSRWQQAEIAEQKLAGHLLTSMISKVQTHSPAVSAYVMPTTLFSGDNVVQVQGPDGSLYVLLADAMGHGLAAAVSLMPIVQAFAAMAKKALPLQNIVFEINRSLNFLLTNDRFVAAVFLHIQPLKHVIECWNGAMPAVWGFDEDLEKKFEFKSKNMALGILDDATFSAQTDRCSLHECMILFMCTDGLLESASHLNSGFNEAVFQHWALLYGDTYLGLKNFVDREIKKPVDDVSFVVVDLQKLHQQSDIDISGCSFSSALFFELTLSGHGVLNSNVTAWLILVAKDINLPVIVVQRLFTVVTELFNNAVEHGVLKLDSAIKQGENGFFDYYQEKDRRAEQLTEADKVSISMQWRRALGEIEITVSDTGEGFNAPNLANLEQFSGRGLIIVKRLCKSVAYMPPGNRVTVVLAAGDSV